MSQAYKNYIGGEWVPGHTTRPNINPSDTKDIIGEFPQASEADVNAALAAAKAAFPGWAGIGILRRAEILDQTAAILLARREIFAEMLAREEGRPLHEAAGEVTRAAQIFRFHAGEALRGGGERLESVRPGVEVEIYREPLGVVALITPWNVPLAIPAWKIAPALAYGNCVILKPAEATPGSAWLLAQALEEAGVPAGVFNLVIGPGRVIGNVLAESSKVDALSFTGSVQTGQAIAASAVRTGKKIQLEMGGKNPLVVLADADIELATDIALDGAFFWTGQRCTASSRLIVEAAVHDAFVARLADKMRNLQVGHALRPGTQLGPVVDDKQFAQDLRYIGIAREEGGEVIGGEVLERDTPGYYLAPALVTRTTPEMRINREEVFGPVASVISVGDYDEALHVANGTEFGLSAGICTNSLKHAVHFRRHVEAGLVTVNLATAGVDFHVPFGGRKASSYGPREQGRYAVEFYTTVKTAYTRAIPG